MREVSRTDLIAFINDTVAPKGIRESLITYIEAIPANDSEEVIATRVFTAYAQDGGHGPVSLSEWNAWIIERYG